MKTLAALLSAGGLAALAVPALAGGPVLPVAEPVVEAPAPVVVPAPSGDWAGFYAGAQLGYADVDSNGAGLDGNGELGGVHAGYRWDLGRTVLGVEADYDTANVDLGGTAGSLDNIARLKFSAGADLGRTLVYATAGAAHASASSGGVDLSDNGWLAGIGMSYALSDQWLVGGELLTHRFKDFDATGVDLDPTTFTLRASYRF